MIVFHRVPAGLVALNVLVLGLFRRTPRMVALALFTLPALIIGLTTALTVVPAEAQSASGDNPVLGTWKLKAFVREVTATGERINQFGEHPDGYLSYSADGRMYAIATSDNRVKPRDENAADEERVKLHQSMFAYAGTYTLEGGKVIHHVDISWNETRTGTDQVRFYKLDGNILTITTAPNKSMVDGQEGSGVLVWEKVKAPPTQ
jgi:hypothetical protein